MPGPYTFTFGDGSPAVQGELGTEVDHEYPGAGTYTITVKGPGGARGQTSFTAGDKPRAQPVTVMTPNPVLATVGVETTYTAHTTNATHTSTGCTGRVSLTGITANRITSLKRNDTAVAVTDQGGKVVATYATDAPFVIGPGFDATATYKLTLAAGTPAGNVTALSEILDGEGKVIGSAPFSITVSAA